jgi:2-polyprenyl-6-methoxyphenol hydroxylase-like FAD-dependent oxidoreductase
MTRRDREDCLRVYLTYAGDNEQLARVLKHGSVAEQKEAWAELFNDLLGAHGVRRYIEGLQSPQADDFYAVEFAQVKLDNWSEGRVVLLGDAGFCPAPITGRGTSLALVGAYVLAGEIARACGKDVQEGLNPWDNLPVALAGYERELMPFVKTVQDVPIKRIVNLMCPKSAWVVTLFHWVAWLVATLRIDQLAAKFGSDDSGPWKMPDYPELSAPKS